MDLSGLNSEKNEQPTGIDGDPKKRFGLPQEIGILPIRSAVAYPGTVMPLAVGRQRSKRLLRDIRPQQTIFGLVAQKKAEVENPAPADLYSVGTAASVLKIIKMPQGSVNIIVHGLVRFRVIEYTAVEPYLKARVEMLSVRTRKTKKLRPWWSVAIRLIGGFLSPNVPDERDAFGEYSDPRRWLIFCRQR